VHGAANTRLFYVVLEDGTRGYVRDTAVKHHKDNDARMRAPWYMAPGAHVEVRSDRVKDTRDAALAA
jgi:hypothetical protein